MTEDLNIYQEPESYSKMAAEVYDAIYAFKDYESEAKQLIKLIEDHKQTNGNELLDVACGTGAHLPYLADEFALTGIDLSSGQITEAKKRLPSVDLRLADMRDFELDKNQKYALIFGNEVTLPYRFNDVLGSERLTNAGKK